MHKFTFTRLARIRDWKPISPAILLVLLLAGGGKGLLAQYNFTAGLKSYYPMNGDYFNAASNPSYHRSFNNAGFAADSFGVMGNAGEFDGTERVNGYSSFMGPSFRNGTVDLWFRDDDTLGTAFRVMVWEGQLNNTGFCIRRAGTAGLQARYGTLFGATGTENILSSQGTYADGQWHHLALVSKTMAGPDSLYLYIDGALESTSAGNFSGSNTSNFTRFGCRDDLVQFWQGAMNDLRFWDRPLTPAEIAQLAALPRFVVDSFPNHTFCKGASDSVCVQVLGGSFQSGNRFVAQLSDPTGSFESPTTLGFVDATASACIPIEFPEEVATGAGYRLRVISTRHPACSDNSPALSITNPDVTADRDIHTFLYQYLTFDSTLDDFSGNGYHGSPNGAPIYTTDRFGNPQGAFQCDNRSVTTFTNYHGSQYINNTTNPLSISIWIRRTGTAFTWQTVYSGFNNSPGINNGLFMGVNGTTFRFRINNGNVADIGFPINEWTHFVGTYEGGIIRLYQNGVEVRQVSAPGNVSFRITPKIGDDNGGTNFQGAVDDFRIYRRALNAAEVKLLHQEGNPVCVSGAVCNGDSLVLDCPGVPGASYLWTGVNGFSATTEDLSFPHFDPFLHSEFQYQIQLNGCPGTVHTARPNTEIAPVVTATGDTACVGDTATLLATGALAGQQYYWYRDEAGNQLLDSGGTVQILAATSDTFYVVLGDGTGCQSSPVAVVLEVAGQTDTLPSLAPFCDNGTPILLPSGVPPGGVWTGPGVTGTQFDPTVAGPGMATLQYNYSSGGCPSWVQTHIEVLPAPGVVFAPLPPLCNNAPAINLTGIQPVGGTLSGNGVTGNAFDPSAVGPGNYPLQYVFTDSNGCADTAVQSITVHPVPQAIFPPQAPVCTDAQPVSLTGLLPTGGILTGPGVNGLQFDPQVTGPGLVGLIYSVTDTNGCADSAAQSIQVVAPPSVQLAMQALFCEQDPALVLAGGAPVGGTYTGPGVTGASFDPALAGVGNHTLAYTFTDTNGCTGTDSALVMVNGVAASSISGDSLATCGDTLVYSVAGTMGSFYDWSVAGNATLLNGQGTPTVEVIVTGASVTLAVVETTDDLCVGDTAFYEVNCLVGVEEQWTTDFRIYPNPSSGKVRFWVPEGNGEWQVSVVNGLGIRVIDSCPMPASLEMDLSDLPVGVYWVTLQSGPQRYTRRLVLK